MNYAFVYLANSLFLGRPIKNLPETITVNSEASANEIFEKIAAASKFSIDRLRVTKGSDGAPIPRSREITVHDTGLRNKSAVDVKDLGESIGKLQSASS